MLRSLPFVLFVAACAVHDAVGVGVCAREGDWVMTFTLEVGSDPLCESIAPQHVGVVDDQLAGRDCDGSCICSTTPGGLCSGTLFETCNNGTTNTAITCGYDLGLDSASGECTAAVSG